MKAHQLAALLEAIPAMTDADLELEYAESEAREEFARKEGGRGRAFIDASQVGALNAVRQEFDIQRAIEDEQRRRKAARAA